MTENDVIAALQTVFDPEIPVNIYDLGLIYNIDISEAGGVDIAMTLTSPGCPVAGEMPGMVEAAVCKLDGVAEVNVRLIWDPPWDRTRMSEEAQMQLGMF
jgi:FeS assembly SUF system protein